jgi:hypothetical protein
MARLTIIDAEGLAMRNRPWTIRLEYHGTNTANASGTSHKYWYATGRGMNEMVECGWGAIGATPANQLIDWTDLKAKVVEKQTKGYVWADTPYIRMSAKSLASLTGVVMAPPTPSTPTPPPAVVATVTPVPSVGLGKINPALVSLGQPFSLIHALRIFRDGAKMIGYKALDSAGNDLLQMTSADGLDFAQKYGLEIKFL